VLFFAPGRAHFDHQAIRAEIERKALAVRAQHQLDAVGVFKPLHTLALDGGRARSGLEVGAGEILNAPQPVHFAICVDLGDAKLAHPKTTDPEGIFASPEGQGAPAALGA